MFREPDWEALDQLQFLLMSRMTEPLNAGLAAISLVHLEEAADKPRAYWQERASGEVLGVLGLVNAWHALIRYKLGELLPSQHIRPFAVQDLLDWLTYQLELVSPLRVEDNLTLESSKEAIQEALLMLYSAAYTLGPSVHLVVQSTSTGVWFRVRYGHSKNVATCPNSLEDLLNQLSGNWRLENTSFEIRTAADFVALSGSQLHLQGSETFCEMAFFVYAIGQRPPEPLRARQVTQPPPIASSSTEELMLSLAANGADQVDTRVLPGIEVDHMIEATIQDVFGDETPPPEDEMTQVKTDEPSDGNYVATPEELENWPVIKLNAEETAQISNTRLENGKPRMVWARALRDDDQPTPPESEEASEKSPDSTNGADT